MDVKKRISSLTPEQRKLLELKLKQKKQAQQEKQKEQELYREPISRVKEPDNHPHPLSFQQERLRFIHRLSENVTAYNLVRVLKLEGELNREALEKSINEVIRRHEVLRTVFREQRTEGEKPYQEIKPPQHHPLEYHTLEGQTRPEQEEEITRRVNGEALHRFDLSEGPLVRTRLIRRNEKEYIFILNIHHQVIDGRSVREFTQEMARNYRRLIEGETPNNPPLPLRYVDYAHWQRGWITADGKWVPGLEKQRRYWQDQYRDEVPHLDLPTDNPRPAIRDYAGSSAEFTLSPEETEGLKKQAGAEKTTTFSILLAMFAIYISKISGREDMVVGTPVAGRRNPALQNMMGLFTNTLPLRIRPGAEKEFHTYQKEVGQHVVDALENQDYPYDMQVRDRQVRREAGRNPLFDVLFELQDKQNTAVDIHGLKLENHPRKKVTAMFDLMLIAEEHDRRLQFEWEYSTTLYRPETIRRHTGYFKRVVTAVLKNPTVKIGEIEIVTPAQKKRLLYDMNGPLAQYPEDKTIHRQFEEQRNRTPDSIAVIGPISNPGPGTATGPQTSYPNAAVTYGELNEKADRLARRLREKGVRPDTIVAIKMERGIELIAGILGILKAGGAYLPIEPETPTERIDYMLKDSAAPIMLAIKLEDSKEQNKESTAILTMSERKGKESDGTRRNNEMQPANIPTSLAYVIYTSGTTGRPKGVLVEHRNVVSLLFCEGFQFDINREDVWTMFHSPSFDFSVWEIFGALLKGSRLVIISKMTARDTAEMVRRVKRQGVTVLNQTPSAFYRFIEEEREQAKQEKPAQPLRYVIFGGEALSPGKLAEWRDRYPATRLINMYGITETTVHVTYKEITQKEIRENRGNIGKPIPAQEVEVLDRQQRQVPPGAYGELYVGGAGVTRGYLNRPQLTAERYVVDPHRPGSRRYRSGDRVQVQENGEMIYGGRLDRQVQIRGYRVELEEIRNRLLNHPHIGEADVQAVEDENGETHICAYYTAATPQADQQLRETLGRSLPGYMIPAYFMRLEKMPLTPNGKVDRKALPEPVITATAHYTPPQNTMQKKLERIWREILGREQAVGIDDNFFQLGGHSLKAARLTAVIRKTLEVKLPLVELFQRQTIRKVSEYLEQRQKENYKPIEPVEQKEYYRLSPAQKRIYFLQTMAPTSTTYNMPIRLRLTEDIPLKSLERAVKQLIRRHESLRTGFREVNDDPVQRVHSAPSFEIEEYRAENEAEVRGIVARFIRPFDLTRAPLMRVALIRQTGAQPHLLVDTHHIVSDGISQIIQAEDYHALLRGETLKPQPIQYKDYSEWRRRRDESGEHRSQQEYWQALYAGEVPRLNIMPDKRRPEVFTFAGDQLRFSIGGETARKLKDQAVTAGATLFMKMQAILNTLYYKITGQEDIIIGTVVAGREHPDQHRVMGVFINTLAMRNRPQGDRIYKDFLKEVSRETVTALENSDVQFEELVERLELEREPARNPLFDTALVVQNFRKTGETKLTGIGQVAEYQVNQNKTAKLDLTFYVTERTDAIDINLEYYTGIYKRETVQRLAEYFKRVIHAVVREPGIRLREIDLITAEEKRQIAEEFNTTDGDCGIEGTLHRQFEEQSRRTPDRTALTGKENHVTYSKLERQAGRLAGRLQQKGVTTDTIVAIKMERSIALLVVILGILKAGGAYLPLDPDYPDERIDIMLKDSAAGIMVQKAETNKNNQNKKGSITELNLDHSDFEIDRNFEIRASSIPSSLAYVIYTSGSTGRPKGVAVQHRSAVTVLTALNRRYPLEEGDVYQLKTPHTFDVSVSEIFGWIFGGRRGEVLGHKEERDPAVIQDNIERHQITHINFVPSMFGIFLEALKEDRERNIKRLKSLKYIFLGGEALQPEHVTAFREFNRDIRLENVYGPTEATIWATAYPLAQWSREGNISIGKPLDGQRIYILNPEHRHQPIGLTGEICIGGAALARGYINNPELTAQRFVVNRESTIGGGKETGDILYRTGDLGRWRPDGNIEYQGRIDHQVKIRGHRIEPGEIAGHLKAHEEIKDAVVIDIQTDRKGAGRQQELYAYIIPSSPENEGALSVPELRAYLAGKLPDYMIPAYFVELEEIPLTTSGKVDHKALRRYRGKTMETAMDTRDPADDIERKIRDAWRDVLKREKVGIRDNFFEQGGNSHDIIRLSNRLKKILAREVPVVTLFQYPTVESLANHIKRQIKPTIEPQIEQQIEQQIEPQIEQQIEQQIKERQEPETENKRPQDIAVIGMAGRFPGARDIDEYWKNLEESRETITFFTVEQLQDVGVSPDEINNPNYVKANGILEDKYKFDAAFFDYLPGEASVMDPQTRLFHEGAWQALEHAGYAPGQYNGQIGLYAGAGANLHWEVQAMMSKEGQQAGEFGASLLRHKDYLATRVSYKLDLKGPSLVVQSACSTSLAAIHTAVMALKTGDCDMALAGGVTVHTANKGGYMYNEGMILSRDGHCYAFDTRANGTVGSEGMAVVLLKPLKAAQADGDTIHAVIKGTALNNDGIRKTGFTAPSVEGQQKAIIKALQRAAVPPESITYVETHGTGTILGDPIEIEALAQALGKNGNRKKKCAIGSVKTNIGHLDSAAGAAGFLKVVQALVHRKIPASLNYEIPNPAIDFEKSPFTVNTQLIEWKNDRYPLRAGVNSSGIGGTNVHVILEEAPSIERREPEEQEKSRLIILSAKTQSALERQIENHSDYLEKNPGISMADVAYTLQEGRRTFRHRAVLTAATAKEAAEKLSTGNGLRLHERQAEKTEIIFMFPGQGAQYVNMGRDLYDTEPEYRKWMDRSFEILTPLMNRDIKEILYPGDPAGEAASGETINHTEITQPLIVSVEYALARMLMKMGIEPKMMIGHSIGEYVAAVLSGVMDLETALTLVVKRGRLMQRQPGGAMLAVPLTEAELLKLRPEELSLAAVNSPDHSVLSGTVEAVADFERQLKEKEINSRRLHTKHAFHSSMMETIIEPFEREVATKTLKEPKIPYMSNVTGGRIKPEEAVSPSYYGSHIRRTVQFSRGIEGIRRQIDPSSETLYIEVGPGKTLSTFVRRHKREGLPPPSVVNLLRHPQEEANDRDIYNERLGQLWQAGAEPHWNELYAGEKRHRIPLPVYPFQGKEYRFHQDPMKIAGKIAGQQTVNNTGQIIGQIIGQHKRTEKKPDIADWFHVPVWEQSPQPVPASENAQTRENWWLFMDECGLGEAVRERLQAQGQHVTAVIRNSKEEFNGDGQDAYTLDPRREEDYRRLVEEQAADNIPHRILHFWGVTGETPPETGLEELDENLDIGFFSLLGIVRALGDRNVTGEIQLDVITDGMQNVMGDERQHPGKALQRAAIRTISMEYSNIRGRSIDIPTDWVGAGNRPERKTVDRLMREFRQPTDRETEVAFRGTSRWVPRMKPIRLEKVPAARPSQLKEKGVYLITGGLGGIGQTLAEYLAETCRARLILIGRTELPARKDWEQWTEEHGAEEHGDQKIRQRIRKLLELEAKGAEVQVLSADIADEEQTAAKVQEAVRIFGPVNGVFHTAGEADYEGIIQGRSHRATRKIMEPKIKGTQVLDRIFADTNLEFLIIFSSLASLLPVFGEVGYAAANSYQDAYARSKASAAGPLTVSINWDAWQEVGMAVESVKRKGGQHRDRLKYGIAPHEGIEALIRIMEYEQTRVAVSPRDPESPIQQEHQGEIEEERDVPAQLDARPPQGIRYTAPADETEQALARIWGEFFGYKDLGVNDDFSELGGDSLKAVTLIARIEMEMKQRIPLPEFFKAPTVRGQAQYIKEHIRQQAAKIERVEEKEYYPLSSAQERLYVLHRMAQNTAYNIDMAVTMKGKVDRERVENVFRRLIGRHESLRTSIIEVDGEPVQRIYDTVPFTLEKIEPEEEQARSGDDARQYAGNRFGRPFELSEAPLLRVGMMRETEEIHHLYLEMHHIIADGQSAAILVEEFAAQYRDKKLPELNIQYKDYARWQARRTAGGSPDFMRQAQYWKEQYREESSLQELPLDNPRSQNQGFDGDEERFRLTEEETAALEAIAAKNNVTRYMQQLAIYNVFQSKLTGAEEITVGTPVAGRNHPDQENQVGMFVNTLVLRNRVEGTATYEEYLKHQKEKTLEAFENREYPYEELVEQVSGTRDPGRNPLFDTMFAYQDRENPGRELPGLTITPIRRKSRTAKFDLTLEVIRTGTHYECRYEYGTALFNDTTIKRYVRYIKEIVASVIREPGRRICDIDMIPAEEKRQIQEEFNATRRPYPDKTIHRQFEEQVEQTPDRIALVGEGDEGFESVSYRELNRRADRRAYQLRTEGLEPGTLGAVLSERRLETVVNLLGILKNGAAYMPISPTFPQERRKYLLKDSNARVFLKGSEIVRIFPKGYRGSRGGPPLALGEPAGRPAGGIDMALAYVLYTSGTTGRPKGVMVEHLSVMRLVRNADYFYWGERGDERLLQTCAMEFDVSTFEIWGPLLNGHGLVMTEPGEVLDAVRLKEKVRRHAITTMWMTTALLNQHVETDVEIFASLRNLFTGGDVLSPPHISRIRRALPSVRVLNCYGPTENTTFSTTYDIDGVGAGSISIGKPVANSTVAIVDRYDNPVPIGVRGELVVGGDGVARGYLNNPELTAEKYDRGENKSSRSHTVRMSIQSKLSGRAYRTGDQARWSPDGNIEFFGRTDHQVKIRGHRVETGEIEDYLNRQNGIREAVVVARQDLDGDKYLCAYYSAGGAQGSDISTSAVRSKMEEYFPNYMVPREIIRLETLPLNASGKVDRRALPEPEKGTEEKREKEREKGTEKGTGQKYEAPGDRLEAQLVAIITEVLSGESRDAASSDRRIGIDDNFFDKGGHSLKAVRVVSRIQKELEVKMPLATMLTQPTVRHMADYIRQADRNRYVPMEHAEEKEYYPQTPAQERLFIHQQIEPDSIVYNLPQVLRLEGEPDKGKLESAFIRQMERHESLRTAFEMKNGQPVQVIREPGQVEFKIEEYEIKANIKDSIKDDIKANNSAANNTKGHEEEGITEREERYIRELVRPFDLSKAPLQRVGLIKTGERRYILVMDRHHIITDGETEEQLTKELIAQYAGEEPSRPRYRYRDYVEWQNSPRQQEIIGKQGDYWRRELAGEIPELNLPADNENNENHENHENPEQRNLDNEGGREYFQVEEPETRRLHEIARTAGATLFMVLQAVYVLTLSKQCNSEDIIVGTPVAGRRHRDQEDIAGMFVNMLPLRSRPEGEKTYLQYQQEVKESTQAAIENQEYPVEDIREQQSRQPGTGHSPLYEAVIVLQNQRDRQGEFRETEIGGMKIKTESYDPKTSKFAITLTFEERAERLSAVIEYGATRFKKKTIQRVIQDFKRVAASVIENPNQKLSEIEILTEEEKHRQLYELNATQAQYPKDKTIHQLFEEQVERKPDRIAVAGPTFGPGVGTRLIASAPNATITYRKLNERANRQAQILRETGVRHEDIVAIQVQRSIEMIIGIMGILKAGAAYLPIDPDNPEERTEYMLKDSNAKILLKNSEARNREEFKSETNTNDQNTNDRNRRSTLAYIIYTSGTTGKPKGVMIEHRNVVRLMKNDKFQFDIDHRDIWTQFHSISFDFSVWEQYGALLYGGKLIVVPKDVARDTRRFHGLLKERGVTVLNQTPTAYRNLAAQEAKEPAAQLAIRYVIFGGEALNPAKLRDMKNRYPETKYINMYGITETTVHVTYKEIGPEEIQRGTSNIGTPIPTLTAYVMDRHQKLVPEGAVGEMTVGGDGVGRGYLNRPELTAEKFVPNPYKPGEILYRSGDRARRAANGDLEYEGRGDRQVKIRGYRIEQGEIESRLTGHAGIAEAVAQVRGAGEGDRRLCAYIVPANPSEAPSADEIKQYLSRTLPEYMIPAHIVTLERIPLTINGKLDRGALPEPGRETGKTVEPPRSFFERQQVEIWAEVLGEQKENIGIDDNFFDQGGHSLKAAHLVSLIHERFGIEQPLAEFFAAPTVREQAAYLEGRRRGTERRIEPVEEKEYYQLSSAQKRLYIINRMEPNSVAYNIPYSLELEGELDRELLERAFQRVIRRQESLRTAFITVDERPVQRIHETVPFTLEETMDPAAFIRPFDLTQAPLMRAALEDTGPKTYRLNLDMHHIITDGTSTAVLAKEITAAYGGEEQPPLEYRYRDYTRWQNGERSSERMERRRQYWQDEYGGGVPRLDMPTDYPRRRVNRYKGDKIEAEIGEAEVRQLKQLAAAEEVTFFMALFAMYSIQVARSDRRGGEDGLVVGVPVAGRHAAPGLRQVIGMFVNTVAIKTHPAPDKTFREYLREVKQKTLQAFDNQDYPFEEQVEQLGLTGEAGRNPLFDVMFAYQNMDVPEVRLPGLTIRASDPDRDVSYFDQVLIAYENGDRIRLRYQYDTQLFKRETVERNVDNYKEIATAVLKNPEIPIGEIQLTHRLLEPAPIMIDEEDEEFGF